MSPKQIKRPHTLRDGYLYKNPDKNQNPKSESWFTIIYHHVVDPFRASVLATKHDQSEFISRTCCMLEIEL